MTLFETQMAMLICLVPFILLYAGYWNFIKWCKQQDETINQLKKDNVEMSKNLIDLATVSINHSRNLKNSFENHLKLAHMYDNATVFVKIKI